MMMMMNYLILLFFQFIFKLINCSLYIIIFHNETIKERGETRIIILIHFSHREWFTLRFSFDLRYAPARLGSWYHGLSFLDPILVVPHSRFGSKTQSSREVLGCGYPGNSSCYSWCCWPECCIAVLSEFLVDGSVLLLQTILCTNATILWSMGRKIRWVKTSTLSRLQKCSSVTAARQLSTFPWVFFSKMLIMFIRSK